MKRRTRDFRAWLVEAISCYDASAELFMPKRKVARVGRSVIVASPRRRRKRHGVSYLRRPVFFSWPIGSLPWLRTGGSRRRGTTIRNWGHDHCKATPTACAR